MARRTMPRREPARDNWALVEPEDLSWLAIIRVSLCRAIFGITAGLAAIALLPQLFGFAGSTVVSGSMLPTIQVGDVAITSPLPPDEYVEGQVISFPNPVSPDQLLLHRIYKIEPDGSFITKGDANEAPDSTPVDPETVIGVGRILVPAIGNVVVWAAEGRWLLVIQTVLISALVLRGILRVPRLLPATRSKPWVVAGEAVGIAAVLYVSAALVVDTVPRLTYAGFVAQTPAAASWRTAAPPAATCTVQWVPFTWDNGATGQLDFHITNHTTSTIAAQWTLVWRFSADQTFRYPYSGSYVQSGATVTFTGADWATIPPSGLTSSGGSLTSPSGRAGELPLSATLNGVACNVTR